MKRHDFDSVFWHRKQTKCRQSASTFDNEFITGKRYYNENRHSLEMCMSHISRSVKLTEDVIVGMLFSHFIFSELFIQNQNVSCWICHRCSLQIVRTRRHAYIMCHKTICGSLIVTFLFIQRIIIAGNAFFFPKICRMYTKQ